MSLDISNIVASRICHDIISPIGAIHNGLELISMTASLDVKSPEMALIHDSCQDARARIEFFRVAFGTYQTGQLMDAPKVQGIANAIYTTPRFDLRWHLESAIDRTWAQVIYMGLMCVERQLTLGGTITVAADADHISDQDHCHKRTTNRCPPRVGTAFVRFKGTPCPSGRAIPSVNQYCRCLWLRGGIQPPRNNHNPDV
jgi:histidine phosphotransferase ChpT